MAKTDKLQWDIITFGDDKGHISMNEVLTVESLTKTLIRDGRWMKNIHKGWE